MRSNFFVVSVLAIAALAGAVAFGDGPAATERTGSAPAKKLPFTVSKETTGIVGPLRADGTPDYLAAMNEKYGEGVVPENNGFVLFLQAVGTKGYLDTDTRARAMKMCGLDEAQSGVATWVYFAGYMKARKVEELDAELLLYQAASSPWNEKDHPDLAAYIEERGKQLDMIVEASKRPKWWCPNLANEDPPVMTVQLGRIALGATRQIGRSLCARAMLRLQAGNFDGFLSDTLAVKRLARQLASNRMYVEYAVACTMDEGASDAIGAAAGGGRLDKNQCEAVQKALAALPPMEPVTDIINESERWTTLDAIVFLSKPGATNAEHLMTIPDATGAQALNTIEQQFVDYDVVLRMANQEYDAMVAATRLPVLADAESTLKSINKQLNDWVDQGEQKNGGKLGMDTGESRVAYSTRVGKAVLPGLVAVRGEGLYQTEGSFQAAEMLDVLLVAAERKTVTGQWPKTLEGLVPAYLPAVLVDRFAKGHVVHYRVSEKGAIIYSVGRDGKDDGGSGDRQKRKDDIAVGVLGE